MRVLSQRLIGLATLLPVAVALLVAAVVAVPASAQQPSIVIEEAPIGKNITIPIASYVEVPVIASFSNADYVSIVVYLSRFSGTAVAIDGASVSVYPEPPSPPQVYVSGDGYSTFEVDVVVYYDQPVSGNITIKLLVKGVEKGVANWTIDIPALASSQQAGLPAMVSVRGWVLLSVVEKVARFNITSVEYPEVVAVGAPFTVNVTVVNIGTATGAAIIQLRAPDGTTMSQATVTLNPGDVGLVVLEATTPQVPGVYNYTVVVINNATGSIDDTYLIQVNATLYRAEIRLLEGWNLIGLSIEPTITSVDELFAGTPVTQVYWFFNGTWYYWIKGSGGTLKEIHAGMGLLVYSQQNTTITLSCYLVHKPYHATVKGWNMLAPVTLDPMPAKDFAHAINATEIYYYDAASGVWLFYIEGNPYSTLTQVEPFHGYLAYIE